MKPAACLALLLSAASGCAPGNAGLIVSAALAPDNQCNYTTSSMTLLGGTLDTSSTMVSYLLTVQYANQLINIGDSTSMMGPPRADPDVINITRAQVTLIDFNGTTLALPGLPNPYFVPATGYVPSSTGTMAGVGVGSIEIIPPSYGAALSTFTAGGATPQIQASVQAVGTTAGGAAVKSPAFIWPMTLCDGCLFLCARAIDGTPQCRASCTPGQDSVQFLPELCTSPPPPPDTVCMAGGT